MNEGSDAYSTTQRRIAEMNDAAKVAEEWRRIGAFIASQSDEDLADYKQQVLNNSDEGWKKLLQGKNPRTSKILMSKIHDMAMGVKA